MSSRDRRVRLAADRRVWTAMVMRSRRIFSVALLFALATPLSAGAAESNRFVSRQDVVSIVSETDSANGSSVALGLLFRLAKDWHIYWMNPGDAGAPPGLALKRPDQKVGAFAWPAPDWLIANSFGDYVVSGTVLLPFAVALSRPAGTRGFDLQGNAHWLVCSAAICVPQEAKFALHLPAGRARPSLAAPLFAAARAAEPVPANFETRVTPAGTLIVTGKGFAAKRVRRAHFFPAQEDAIVNAAPQPLAFSADGFSLDLKLRRRFGATALVGVLEITDAGGVTRAFAVTAPFSPDRLGSPAARPIAFDPGQVSCAAPSRAKSPDLARSRQAGLER